MNDNHQEDLATRQARSRRARNIAIGVVLGLFVVLVYVITVVKLGPGAIVVEGVVMAATRNNRIVAFATVAVVAGMTGLSFAAVPLYKMFCQVTGYGGTPRIATGDAGDLRGERSINVRFDTNVGNGLPWTFRPEQTSIDLRTGETATVFFKVKNNSTREWAAMASFNVSPDQSGMYFNKISCFCFDEQKLGPGETAEFPVVFYLDPKLEADEVMRKVDSVTLSYTFFPSKAQPSVTAAGEAKPRL